MACFGCFGGGVDEAPPKKPDPPRSQPELKPSRSQKTPKSDPAMAQSSSQGNHSGQQSSSQGNHSGHHQEGQRVEQEAGARVDPASLPQQRRTNSFKRDPSIRKGEEGSAGPELPRSDSRDSRRGGNAASASGGSASASAEPDLGRNRSLRKNTSDSREPPMSPGFEPPSPSEPAAAAPAVANRGMKLTQSLKAPPPKAPQPAFSLSKKKPKDAATEARLQEEASKLDELLKSSDLRAFQYLELKAATKGFSMDMLIGAGGFGKVYRGLIKLPPQDSGYRGSSASASEGAPVEVAIKRLEAKSLQGHKEWMVEICMLGLVNHPHLVKLLGFCAEGEKRLLVYEFLPYYSLDRYLFALDPSQPILDWDTRLRISLGSARGLAHLHEEISPPIIYRDFKTSNILLDEDFNPKLSDFGLAREGPSMDRTHVSTQVRGTAGYAAPEYMLTGHLTPKADVWSFGVVLLEMLTGRPSIDQRKPQAEMKLVPLARQRLQQPGDILELMDPCLEGQFPAQAAAKVAEVAKWCLQSDPNNRPLMSELVEVLAYLSRPEQWDMA